jgi:hypothetical protein
MRYGNLIENVRAYRTMVAENLLPALILSFVTLLPLLYVRGMVRAYRAAGDDWKRMDRDVRMVFLFAVPLFRGGIKLVLWADRLFYTPTIERMGQAPADTSDARRQATENKP